MCSWELPMYLKYFFHAPDGAYTGVLFSVLLVLVKYFVIRRRAATTCWRGAVRLGSGVVPASHVVGLSRSSWL